MRKVELRMNEEYNYKIIKKLVETNGNKQRAAVKLKKIWLFYLFLCRIMIKYVQKILVYV